MNLHRRAPAVEAALALYLAAVETEREPDALRALVYAMEDAKIDMAYSKDGGVMVRHWADGTRGIWRIPAVGDRMWRRIDDMLTKGAPTGEVTRPSPEPRAGEVVKLREIATQLRDDGLPCNCDLDNWQPEESTGHSFVCRIHHVAMSAHALQTGSRVTDSAGVSHEPKIGGRGGAETSA